jgi:hypothetical protein
MEVSLRLLDQHHPEARIVLRRPRSDGRQKHRHVKEIVEAQPILVHLQGDEFADLGAQIADDAKEYAVAEGERALLGEPVIAGHPPEALVDLVASVDDGGDLVELLVRFRHELDDLVPVFVVVGRERRQQGDQLVIAPWTEIGGGVAKRV